MPSSVIPSKVKIERAFLSSKKTIYDFIVNISATNFEISTASIEGLII